LSERRTLAPASNRPLFVCQGKDCRKKADRLCALKDSLQGQGEIISVQCQKICKGPVAGLEINGQIEWFSKLNDEKSLRQLGLLLQSGELKKRLKGRISLKRSSKIRGDIAMAAK
jgi:hypothetical protein